MTRPLNAILIGLGMVADMHAAAIAATGGAVRLAAVHARRRDQAESFAARHGAPAVLETVDDILAVEHLDFAVLTTPPDARASFVSALAGRGLPILMEKPVARTLAEARSLVDTCAQAGVPLGIVFQHRMRPAALRLMALVTSGTLGNIASAELRVPWWRDQSYYDAPGRGTYARDGGGVLMTQAIHSLDLLAQFCGPVTEVQAMAATSRLHRMEAEDFAAAALRFRSGAVGSVMASVTHFPGGAEEINLNGTRASAQLTADRLRLFHRDGRTEEIGEAGATGGGADPMAFSHDWHRAVIEDFAEAIRTGRAPSISGRSALDVHALIEAITRSARSGRRETVEATDD